MWTFDFSQPKPCKDGPWDEQLVFVSKAQTGPLIPWYCEVLILINIDKDYCVFNFYKLNTVIMGFYNLAELFLVGKIDLNYV
jgi:hypothetical protein